MVMTIMVPITLIKQPRNISTLEGMLTSTVSTSLPKRLTMRPIGVVSKNIVGRRNTVLSRVAWSSPDALRPPNAFSITASQMNTPVGTENTKKSSYHSGDGKHKGIKLSQMDWFALCDSKYDPSCHKQKIHCLHHQHGRHLHTTGSTSSQICNLSQVLS